MSVTPVEILRLAESIGLEDSEVARRIAIGRAYCAAMHEARSVLPEAPRTSSSFRGCGHEDLIAGLQPHFHGLVPGRSYGAMIAEHLSALKGKRVLADYRRQYFGFRCPRRCCQSPTDFRGLSAATRDAKPAGLARASDQGGSLAG